MAHRPFTPRQQRQNARFLAALRRTGNVRLACRELGVHRACYTKRRAKCAAFATQWDMTLAAAHAAFHLAGGARLPDVIASEAKQPSSGLPRRSAPRNDGLRTKGGEPVIVRRANGRLQLRLAPAGWMTKAAEQAFFSALSATANVRLACAAAGFAPTSFYRRRGRSAAFAREMRLALRIGWERLEEAMLAAGLAHSHEDDAWRTLRESYRPGGSPPPAEFWKGVDARLLGVLTEEQKAKWGEMTGEPFRGEIHFGFPPPGDQRPDGKAPPPP